MFRVEYLDSRSTVPGTSSVSLSARIPSLLDLRSGAACCASSLSAALLLIEFLVAEPRTRSNVAFFFDRAGCGSLTLGWPDGGTFGLVEAAMMVGLRDLALEV